MKKILPVFLIIAAILAAVWFVPQTLAQNETIKSIPFPPTSEGPGMILPDSPFYFLDQMKQNIRLAFAVTPVQKARVYSSVAGERIAELRFELARNNISAAEIAVRGIRENTAQAAKAVNEAKLWGTDISDLAKEINISIKEHQQELDVLEAQSSGALKAEVYIAQAALSEAKTIVEQSLPKEEITGELLYDFERNAYRQASLTLENATTLQRNLDLLQQTDSSVSSKTTPKKSPAVTAQTVTKVQNIITNAESVKASLETSQITNTPTPTPVKSGK